MTLTRSAHPPDATSRPAAAIDLDAGARLWLVDLDRLRPSPELLDAHELERLGRFTSTRTARRYAARHTALRVLLGGALDLPPARVPLELGPQGKPRLACESDVSFSLSHRAETAVIALVTGAPVGVDVETIRPHTSPRRVAERFFAAEEVAMIAALPAPLAATAFLRCWTAKEAVLKAIGSGLTAPLRDVVIDADPRKPLHLLRVPGPLAAGDWTLHGLCVGPGLAVTLAVARPDVAIAGVQQFVLSQVGVALPQQPESRKIR